MDEVPNPEELIETPPAEASSAGSEKLRDPYAPWRRRDYRLYLFGNMAVNIGANMQSVAVGWELYERTGSAMSLAWVGLVQALPIMLLALPAGQLADRLDRRKIVLFGLLVMAAASLGLAIVSHQHGSVEWMYAMLLIGAGGRAFFWPASQALLPQLVPNDEFSSAVTWRSTAYQMACVTGPALGGFMIGLQRTTMWVYVVDAGMTFANCCCVAAIAPHPMTRLAESASVKTLLAGFRYVINNKLILAAITLDLFAILLGGATALLPIYARDILQVGPTGLGWLRAAPAVGAISMAVTLSHRPPLRRAGRALLLAVTVFGIVTIVFGISTSFWLSLLMLACCGAADNISVVVRHSLVQLRTPNEMRGRVSAVNSVFISASNELGEFESGTVARFFGPVASVVSGGIGTIIVVAMTAWMWPEIRRLGPLQESSSRKPPSL
jgi:MFS family permease